MNQLLRNYSSLGFHVVGLPCDQFYLQEPGRNDELLHGIRYIRPGNNFIPHVNMSIYSKINVNGRKAHPLYNYLKGVCPQTLPDSSVIANKNYIFWDEITDNDITWNFEKFLIDRYGRPRFRFHPGAWNGGKFILPWLNMLMAETYTPTTIAATPTPSQAPTTSHSGGNMAQSQVLLYAAMLPLFCFMISCLLHKHTSNEIDTTDLPIFFDNASNGYQNIGDPQKFYNSQSEVSRPQMFQRPACAQGIIPPRDIPQTVDMPTQAQNQGLPNFEFFYKSYGEGGHLWTGGNPESDRPDVSCSGNQELYGVAASQACNSNGELVQSSFNEIIQPERRSVISHTSTHVRDKGITHKLDEQFVKHQVSEFSVEWNPNVELSSACEYVTNVPPSQTFSTNSSATKSDFHQLQPLFRTPNNEEQFQFTNNSSPFHPPYVTDESGQGNHSQNVLDHHGILEENADYFNAAIDQEYWIDPYYDMGMSGYTTVHPPPQARPPAPEKCRKRRKAPVSSIEGIDRFPHLITLKDLLTNRQLYYCSGGHTDTDKVGRCNLCGSVASESGEASLELMKPHLYSHLSKQDNLYACAYCMEYSSNCPARVRQHIRKKHKEFDRNKDHSAIIDRRSEMDEALKHLARRCYGF